MKKITAKEISKNLPIRVKCINDVGMFKNTIIRFHTINTVGNLIGNVIGNPERTICVIYFNKEFELLI